jgi:hypothetical protein
LTLTYAIAGFDANFQACGQAAQKLGSLILRQKNVLPVRHLAGLPQTSETHMFARGFARAMAGRRVELTRQPA